jgi:5,10-methylenetetrahydrofolate reductase
LKVSDRLAGGRFARVVEVFPPSFSADRAREPQIGLRQKERDFVERVRKIVNLADAFLIADVKDTDRFKISTTSAAVLLREELGVEAIPVFTARDGNSASLRSSILTALSQGVDSMMFVWGDRYPRGSRTRNVYDYGSLAELIADARGLAERAGVEATLLAPVDLTKLSTRRGRELALSRLRSGAKFLLAQPPTTDSFATLGEQVSSLRDSKLEDKVLLNVFPFRGVEDVRYCREKFGWKLPSKLDSVAEEGEPALLKEARRVAEGIESYQLPGVYVSTRGRPELARFILD